MNTERTTNLVITIGRLKGSGGVQVGKQLAVRLNCRYLDKEILSEAATLLHRDPEALEAVDDKKLNFWERTRLEYAEGLPTPFYVPPPLNLRDSGLLEAENVIIREAVHRGPAVVVGRAGFHVLRDEPGLLSVFLHAPFDRRVDRVMDIHRIHSRAEAEDVVRRSDRQREGFMKTAVGHAWLDPRNFHLCLDTHKLGLARTTDLILAAASGYYSSDLKRASIAS